MKNGFTLIELLAVIIVLAVISLITVVAVDSTISKSKDTLSDTQKTNIEESAKAYYLKEGMSNNDTCINVSELIEKGYIESNVVKDPKDKEEMTGSVKITYEANQYSYKYQEDSCKIICKSNEEKVMAYVWQEGDPDFETSYLKEPVGLLATQNGLYTPGVTYTCNFIDDNEINDMVFYVLSSTEKEVTLIAGFNLGNDIVWSEDGKNHINETEDNQAITAKSALADRTSEWNKLTEEQKSTIKLPSAYQIAETVEQTFTGDVISDLPKWLISYTTFSSSYGYWTSTPSIREPAAWRVYHERELDDYPVSNENIGVRPVITLPKTLVN